MVRLAQEKDIEILRQAALLLEQENKRLVAKIIELTRQLMAARGEEKEALQMHLTLLQQQLAAQTKRIFGDSSEKRPRNDEREGGGKPDKDKPKGHGPTAQLALPSLVVEHDLDEPDKVCPQCGHELSEWPGQFEESEEIDVVERIFVLKKHRQKKYRCSCGGCVETAPGPQKLFPGARYSIDVALVVAVQKYLEHLPLERQVRTFLREGLAITSQTLWDYIERLARLLLPAYERLHAHVLAQPVLGADETWWRLMGKTGDKRGSKRWHAWLASAPDAIYFCIEESRSVQAAEALLPRYAGIVMCDGYGAYESLARMNPALRLAHCWAHVRRKFLEVEASFPDETARVLDLIGELYAVEAECPRGPPGEELRQRLRRERSRRVVEQIEAWVYSTYPALLPESGLAKAIRYMGGMWSGLLRFLDDPRIPLDNNHTERAVRGPVVGRKNHYGSRSRRGTEVAALFYSFMESAKLCGLDPKAYLRLAVRAALAEERIPLPHEVAARGEGSSPAPSSAA